MEDRMASEKSLHTPKEVAARLGISVSTVGDRSREFPEYLSPTAQTPVREPGHQLMRRFTDGDVDFLAVVQPERAMGTPAADIKARLVSGELLVNGVVATRRGGPLPEAPANF